MNPPPMRPAVGGDPWRELTAAEKRRLPRDNRRVYPPKAPSVLNGDSTDAEVAAVYALEDWIDNYGGAA